MMKSKERKNIELWIKETIECETYQSFISTLERYGKSWTIDKEVVKLIKSTEIECGDLNMSWKQAVEGDQQELNRLLSLYGVDVELLKYRKVKYTDVPGYYDLSYLNQGEHQLIPTSKIVGFGRGTIGVSFYQLLQGKSSEIALERIEFYLQRFEGCKKSEIEKWFASDQCDRISVQYLIDTDEYIVTGDGNHRGIVSTCLGIPYLRARVSEYKLNPERKKRYDYQNAVFQRCGIQKVLCDSFDDEPVTVSVYLDIHSVTRCVLIPTRRFMKNTYYESMDELEKCISRDLKIAQKIRRFSPSMRKAVYRLFSIENIEDYLVPISEFYDCCEGSIMRRWEPYKFLLLP